MKRLYLFGFLAVIAAVLALSFAMVDAAPPAQGGETPAAKPKANKTPLPTLQAVTADPDDTDDVGDTAVTATSAGAMTSKILVFNPDSAGDATVQIDVYNLGGTVAHSTTVNVSKNGAKLVTLPGGLGSNFQGGAVVLSDKNVQALVIGANKKNNARDAYEGATSPGTDVVLPFVRHLAQNTQNTLLAIQNTTANPAAVTVTLYDASGAAVNTQNANLVAYQPLYLNTNTLFPTSTFVGSARVTSNQNIAVAAQSQYLQDPAAFNGQSTAAQDTTLFISAVVRKVSGAGVGQNWSELYVRNNGGSATNITVEFYSTTGAPVGSQTANDIAPNGSAQFVLKDAAFDSLGRNFNGWAKVTSSGEPIAAAALSNYSKGKRMYGMDATPNSDAAARAVCGDVFRTPNQTSRMTILNTGSTKAKTRIFLYDANTGARISKAKLNVPPNAATTVLLSDPGFVKAGTNYEGMALVKIAGAAPPNVVVTVNTPYGSPKLTGTVGYQCTSLQ